MTIWCGRHNTIPLRNPGAEAYEKLDERLQWMRHDEQQREQLGSQVKAVIQSRCRGDHHACGGR